jgi:hypothetical protein
MRNRMSLTPVLTIGALGTLALFFLAPVNKGISQDERGPCPKPYIKVVSPNAGLPGDRVEIRGHRFGTEKGNVFFSPNVKAEVLEWTNTRIWVIVPRSATSGRIGVSVPCGSVSNSSHFKIIE